MTANNGHNSAKHISTRSYVHGIEARAVATQRLVACDHKHRCWWAILGQQPWGLACLAENNDHACRVTAHRHSLLQCASSCPKRVDRHLAAAAVRENKYTGAWLWQHDGLAHLSSSRHCGAISSTGAISSKGVHTCSHRSRPQVVVMRSQQAAGQRSPCIGLTAEKAWDKSLLRTWIRADTHLAARPLRFWPGRHTQPPQAARAWE